LRAAETEAPFQLGGLRALVDEVVQAVRNGDDLLVQALDDTPSPLDLSRHMLNTAVCAIKIGQGAEYRVEELSWIGLAGCVHDVGMVVVPRRVLDKPEPLSDEETALIRRHPDMGYRILAALGPEYEWLANTALQEHEREDGSGYPRGLQGREIHEYAKIVGLADAYEALTHSRPYRHRRGPFEVVKHLVSSDRAKFPDRALKGLIRGLSAFPVGSFVRLNSGEIARIAATNTAFPLRPVVEVLVGPRGERLAAARRMDLSANTLLYIVEACSPPQFA
jgi:HD-GYP domain-containing protein (c-di-GMP phosphodiesterase class II)